LLNSVITLFMYTELYCYLAHDITIYTRKELCIHIIINTKLYSRTQIFILILIMSTNLGHDLADAAEMCRDRIYVHKIVSLLVHEHRFIF
jgi:hypothetical protein